MDSNSRAVVGTRNPNSTAIISTIDQIASLISSRFMCGRKLAPTYSNATYMEHQRYWRDQLRWAEELFGGEEPLMMPPYLTEPPVNEFRIRALFHGSFYGDYYSSLNNAFVEKHLRGSTLEGISSLPEMRDSIVLRNPNGVTVLDFLSGVADFLFGDSLPLITNSKGMERRFPVQDVDFTFPIGGEAPDGRFLFQHTDPVWVYMLCALPFPSTPAQGPAAQGPSAQGHDETLQLH